MIYERTYFYSENTRTNRARILGPRYRPLCYPVAPRKASF